MKISRIDLQIIELIKSGDKEGEIYNLKKLSEKLNKSPQQLHRNLRKLRINGILEKVGKNPAYYFIGKAEENLQVLPVQCRCGYLETAPYGQISKVCSACRRHYLITKRRLDFGKATYSAIFKVPLLTDVNSIRIIKLPRSCC